MKDSIDMPDYTVGISDALLGHAKKLALIKAGESKETADAKYIKSSLYYDSWCTFTDRFEFKFCADKNSSYEEVTVSLKECLKDFIKD